MNIQPIIRSLDAEDFGKMLAACTTRRDRIYLQIARHDPLFEYHIVLPGDPAQTNEEWINDPKRFPE